MRVIVEPAAAGIPLGAAEDPAVVKGLIAKAKAWNRENKFFHQDQPVAKDEKPSWWTRNISGPLGSWWAGTISGPLGETLKKNFPKTERTIAADSDVGNLAVFYLSLSKPPESGKEVPVTFSRRLRGVEYVGFGKGDKGFRLVEGERIAFTSENWKNMRLQWCNGPS